MVSKDLQPRSLKPWLLIHLVFGLQRSGTSIFHALAPNTSCFWFLNIWSLEFSCPGSEYILLLMTTEPRVFSRPARVSVQASARICVVVLFVSVGHLRVHALVHARLLARLRGRAQNPHNVKPRVYMSLCPRGSHWLAFSGAQALWGKIFYRAPPRGRMLFLSLNALERCIWTRLRLESESVLILIPKTDTKNCLGGSDAECGFSMPSCIHVLTDAACKRPRTHIRK